MNDLETKEYLGKLKQLSLSDSSRARIQDNLLEYAQFHGVRAQEDSRLIMQVPQRTSLLTLFKQPKSMTAALIAIALIAGGGTSYAAVDSVPGDFLYPVKTEVNENFKSAFTFSNEAEAELQAELANERLEEAEALAVRGALTADASARLGAQIKNHYDEAMARSAAAEADGNYETSAAVRASLEGSFRTHASVLADLTSTISGNNSSTLISELRTYADTTASTQVQASTSIDTSIGLKHNAEATVVKAERFIAEVTNDLARAKTRLSAEAYARSEAKLSQALTAHAEAKASLEAGAYAEAYTAAQTALRIAHEVETVIDSSLNLNVNLNLDTDTIIDVDLNKDKTDSTTEPKPEKNENNIDVDLDATIDSALDTELLDRESLEGTLEAGLRF